MSKLEPGGPAFPVSPELVDRLGCTHSQSDAGMSLRDWFAGQALTIVYCRFANGSDPTPDDLALQAYAIADAMLQERAK
jgi:hypothetical protein